MTGILERVRPREIRQLEEETEEKNHIKTDTETAFMLPQAEEPLKSPGAGRGKEGFSPRAFRGSVALSTH